MARVLWDQVGVRRFETGLDRGVLYLPDNTGVAWNGLTSVEEDLSDIAVESFYLDGIKYLNRRSVGDFSATMKALTYPDEFLQFEGLSEVNPGFIASNQAVNRTFGLCYRTIVGNDEDGVDHGYKLHILYNLTAKPANKSYSTLSSATSPLEFSWTISGIPVYIEGFRPTVHFVIDSTSVLYDVMSDFEDLLYGTDITSPKLPDIETLASVYQDLIDASN